MLRLTLASLIWAFSFGLIKNVLGTLDPFFVTTARLALSFVVFAPLLRLGRKGSELRSARLILNLVAIGVVEYGLMYLLYISSFQYLPAYQVALFTVFTPILVWWINGIYMRRLDLGIGVPAAIAVLSAGLVSFKVFDGFATLTGFLLVQGSGVCFSLGQIHHREVLKRHPRVSELGTFAWQYAGAFGVALLALVVRSGVGGGIVQPIRSLTSSQAWGLAYAGTMASGVGFFLWNSGARRVDVGVLAVMNNLKVPLAVAAAIFVFGESADSARLGISALLMATGIWMARRLNPERTSP